MDGTQTSEPTGGGPASPGDASAFRRALDNQAVHADVIGSEGPLDLTAPVDLAEMRAALSNSGNIPRVPADPQTRSLAMDGGGRVPRRLGRIAVFVALTAALSVGTACALVLSSNSQTGSVPLPPTDGNIPVAVGQPSQAGQLSETTHSSASASPHPTPSKPRPTPTYHRVTPSAVPSPTHTVSASPSPTAVSNTGQPAPPPTTGAPSPQWQTISMGSSNANETYQVQQMLDELQFMYQNNSGTRFYNSDTNAGDPPDDDGTYGYATADAVYAFQQWDNITNSPAGVCDQATYNALVQAANS